jgi:hypothetical protein
LARLAPPFVATAATTATFSKREFAPFSIAPLKPEQQRICKWPPDLKAFKWGV